MAAKNPANGRKFSIINKIISIILKLKYHDKFSNRVHSYQHPTQKGLQNPSACFFIGNPCYMAGLVPDRQNISMAIMDYTGMGDRRIISLPRSVCFQKI
jgi:hypothetical protein